MLLESVRVVGGIPAPRTTPLFSINILEGNNTMPQVARQNDRFSTGHKCTTTSTVTGPSTNVFANGRGVERKGDPSVVHTIKIGKKCKPHSVKIASGSSTVFVNGKPIARVGDSIDSGAITSGSNNVFAGG